MDARAIAADVRIAEEELRTIGSDVRPCATAIGSGHESTSQSRHYSAEGLFDNGRPMFMNQHSRTPSSVRLSNEPKDVRRKIKCAN